MRSDQELAVQKKKSVCLNMPTYHHTPNLNLPSNYMLVIIDSDNHTAVAIHLTEMDMDFI